MDFNIIKLVSIGLLSFLLIFFITPLTRYLGNKLKIFDFPNKRKLHNKIIIRSGGVSIFSSFFITITILFLFLSNQILEIVHLGFILKIIICSFFFFLIGLLDDLIKVPPFIRLSIEIMLSCWVWSFGLQIQLSNLFPNIYDFFPFLSIPLFSLTLTVIWITGLTNAINWIDGMDGVLSIFATFTCIGFVLISFILNNILESMILVSISGCSLGFLFQNIGKNKMFMGDSGSYFLGFCLATFGIISTNSNLGLGKDLYFYNYNLWVPLIMLFIPIFDMTRVIFIRLINSQSPFHSDKRHFHHLLVAAKYDWKEIIILFIGATQFTLSFSLNLAKISDIKLTFISILIFLGCVYISKNRLLSRLNL